LKIAPGILSPGPLNAITDVAGVRVGHATVIEGERIRTGVTAIIPHAGNHFQDKVAGAVFVGNAFGKLAGSTQVQELGTIETPIVLTNTTAVGTAVDAVIGWTLAQPGNEQVRSVNALVGETNDGGLNDIRSQPVKKDHVLAAIRDAREGAVAEGNVGAGTGTVAFGFKGGIGTSSRVVTINGVGYTVGALVQSNYGGVLSIDGVPVGKEWRERTGSGAGSGSGSGAGTGAGSGAGSGTGSAAPGSAAPVAELVEATSGPGNTVIPAQAGIHVAKSGSGAGSGSGITNGDGSCMIVIATDAPLSARDLQRLAARGVFALARTGSSFSNGSGDFAIAFSTAPELRVKFGSTALASRPTLPTDAISPLFEAVLEATEEAVYNSLLKAVTMTGNGRTVQAIDITRLMETMKKYGR
jgi:D-aminopeptidase